MCEFHEAEKLYKNILREHPNYVDCKIDIFDVLMTVMIIIITFYLQGTSRKISGYYKIIFKKIYSSLKRRTVVVENVSKL